MNVYKHLRGYGTAEEAHRRAPKHYYCVGGRYYLGYSICYRTLLKRRTYRWHRSLSKSHILRGFSII